MNTIQKLSLTTLSLFTLFAQAQESLLLKCENSSGANITITKRDPEIYEVSMTTKYSTLHLRSVSADAAVIYQTPTKSNGGLGRIRLKLAQQFSEGEAPDFTNDKAFLVLSDSISKRGNVQVTLNREGPNGTLIPVPNGNFFPSHMNCFLENDNAPIAAIVGDLLSLESSLLNPTEALHLLNEKVLRRVLAPENREKFNFEFPEHVSASFGTFTFGKFDRGNGDNDFADIKTKITLTDENEKFTECDYYGILQIMSIERMQQVKNLGGSPIMTLDGPRIFNGPEEQSPLVLTLSTYSVGDCKSF